jgi:hypothetical protein
MTKKDAASGAAMTRKKKRGSLSQIEIDRNM